MPRAAVATPPSDARERILTSALEVFALQGFEGAKTRDIASRADVTLGLLQYYFGSKPKLWQAAVDLAFSEIETSLASVLESTSDDRERMRLVLRLHVEFIARRPQFVQLMHDEGKRRGPRMRWLVDRHVKPIHAKILPLIESAQKRGDYPADLEPIHILYSVIGAAGIIFHQAEECKRIAGFDPAERHAVDAHLRVIEFFFSPRQPLEDAT